MRPVIGSKYCGPDLDRPSLRQLPRGWVLEDDEPRPHYGDRVVATLVVVLWLAIVVRAIAVWLLGA